MSGNYGNIHGVPKVNLDYMRRKFSVPLPEILDYEGNPVIEETRP